MSEQLLLVLLLVLSGTAAVVTTAASVKAVLPAPRPQRNSNWMSTLRSANERFVQVRPAGRHQQLLLGGAMGTAGDGPPGGEGAVCTTGPAVVS